jgi:hypothetical protein
MNGNLNSNSYFWDLYSKKNSSYRNNINLNFDNNFDLIEFLKSSPPSNEIRVGYILYSKLSLNSSKMNNIFNLLMQKINPNIRVQSMWEVLATSICDIPTEKGIEKVSVDKIRIKLLIRPNDKDIAIKKLTEMNINYMKKNNKKVNEYLENYKD